MCRVLLSKYIQSVLELVLLDVTMSCEVSACWAMFDKIVLGEKALGTGVIARGEVDLGKEEGVIRVAYSEISAFIEALADYNLTSQGQELVTNVDGGLVLVFVHSILSPFFQQLLHDKID